MTYLSAAGAALLLVAGSRKLRNPQLFRVVLVRLHLPAPRVLAYVIALLEVGVGLTTLATGARVGLLLQMALYALFVPASLFLRERGATDCGCFGGSSPPSRWHVGVDTLLSAGALLAMIFGSPSYLAVLRNVDAIHALGIVLALGVPLWLLLMAFEWAPRTFGAWGKPVTQSGVQWRTYSGFERSGES